VCKGGEEGCTKIERWGRDEGCVQRKRGRVCEGREEELKGVQRKRGKCNHKKGQGVLNKRCGRDALK
jgi:hypothetical protein